MASKRTVILIAAVLVGAVAAYAIYTYVNGIEDRAYENVERVEVWVVAENIPANTDGDSALGNRLIVKRQIPREFYPASAVTMPEAISGKVAKVDLVVGQVLVEGMFVNRAEVVASWADQLDSNEVACSAQFDEVRAAGGLLTPGDRVTILVEGPRSLVYGSIGSKNPEQTATEADANAPTGTTDDIVSWLYQNVEILAIGTVGISEAQAGVDAPGGGLITFKAPPEACGRIAWARDQLYLMLEPKDYMPEDFSDIDNWNILDGALTPDAEGGAGASDNG